MRASASARPSALVAIAIVLAVALGAGACARPYRGPKTLATIGVAVLAGSAGLWVAGDRLDNRGLAWAGAAGATGGALAAIAAGAWIAGAAGCNVDPDCPDEEVCREIPAPPGREPFRQCSPR